MTDSRNRSQAGKWPFFVLGFLKSGCPIAQRWKLGLSAPAVVDHLKIDDRVAVTVE